MNGNKNRLALISVVIPAFNEEKNLEKTLKALQNQTYTKPIEIIVVDNNSTDQTRKVAENLGAWVILETQKGVTFARQTGFFNARGDIILSTDADTIVPSHWVETYAREFLTKPDAVLINGTYRFSDKGYSLKLLQYVFFPMFGLAVGILLQIWQYEKTHF